MSRVLLVPDLGQDAEFWESLGLANESQAPIQPPFGSQTDLEWRSNQLGKHLNRLEKPVRLIAYGFGCLIAVAATTGKSHAIKGALLVTPSDPGLYELDTHSLTGALSFPSVFIARANDPWMSLERARQWSRRWGSRLIHVGEGDSKATTTGFSARRTYRESNPDRQAIEPQDSGNERCWRTFVKPSEYRLTPG